MAKGQPSAAVETPLPAPEPPPSEEVVTEPEGEEPAAPAQEPEKPDVRAQLAELPEEERDRVFQETYGDRFQRLEQSAQDKAYARLMAQQQRQYQANQQLQDTLRNLDAESDDTKRAQTVHAYAESYARATADAWANQALDDLRQTLGVSEEQHDELVMKLHRAATRENRVATFGDYVKAVTGERYVTKQQMSKEQREEIAALVEEAVGKRLVGQPAPVSLGPGEPATKNVEEAWLEGKATYDEYLKWRKDQGLSTS